MAKAKQLKFGDPMDPATDVGTVINEGSAKLFERRVQDAVTSGSAQSVSLSASDLR